MSRRSRRLIFPATVLTLVAVAIALGLWRPADASPDAADRSATPPAQAEQGAAGDADSESESPSPIQWASDLDAASMKARGGSSCGGGGARSSIRASAVRHSPCGVASVGGDCPISDRARRPSRVYGLVARRG